MSLKTFNAGGFSAGDFIWLQLYYDVGETWSCSGWDTGSNMWVVMPSAQPPQPKTYSFGVTDGSFDLLYSIFGSDVTSFGTNYPLGEGAIAAYSSSTIDRIGDGSNFTPSAGSPSIGHTNATPYLIVPNEMNVGVFRYVRITFSGALYSPPGTTEYIISARDILNIADLCFRGDSLVTVFNKKTNEEETKEAKNVVKGDLVKSTTRGYVPVISNIITGANTKFYLFKKGCLDTNLPDHDFYATTGHPIYFNGTEKKASEYEEAEIINTPPEEVYSFVTDEREYIKINNLDVCTWGLEKWKTYVDKHKPFYKEQ
jgi:hypothetical protein